MSKQQKKISIVVSVYNEELSLNRFYEVISSVLVNCKWDYELIFVNDGSGDNSLNLLKKFADIDPKVKVIEFSRNFGHEAAMIAGIDYAQGDGIICMDADLQHPPMCIPEILEKFDEGYEVISMIRTKNEDVGLFNRFASGAFYKVLNLLSPIKFEANSSDFFAISRSVADVLRTEYREKVRYLRGYVQSSGFKQTTLDFVATKREAGESKYSFKKLFKFAITTLCSFSDMPLKVGLYSGMVAAFLGTVLMVYTLIMKFAYGAPSGYSTIIVALCFLFALTLVVIGIIGQYIAILFTEIKDRPIYIVRSVISNDTVDDSKEQNEI